MKILILFPKIASKKSMSTQIHPPGGLGIIAAYIPQGHEIQIIDENVEPIPEQRDFNVVMISALTINALRGYELAREFKESGATVIMGGVHVTFESTEAMEYVDTVVIGEAENLIPQIIADFEAGKLQRVYKAESFTDITDIKLPRRDLINVNLYSAPNIIMSTRGCPFDCSFCSVTTFYGTLYRTRSIKNIMTEIEYMLSTTEGDRRTIYFMDDNFSAKKKFTLELMNQFNELDDFSWTCLLTAKDAVDDTIAELLSATNCVEVFIGMESINETSLQNMNKGHNKIEQYELAIKNLHDKGIPLCIGFILGNDEDDESVFENVFNFAQKNAIDSANFSILTPFPGTKLQKQLIAEGRILHNNWDLYGWDDIVFEPKNMSLKTLQNGVHWLWEEFYSDKEIARRQKMSPLSMQRAIESGTIEFYKEISNAHKEIRSKKSEGNEQ